MDFQQALEYALDGDAVVFIGAGFSLGAKNGRGEPIKSGGELDEHFATRASITGDFELQDAAEAFVERFGEAELLKELVASFAPPKLRGTIA